MQDISLFTLCDIVSLFLLIIILINIINHEW